MEPADHVAAVAREGAALAGAVGRAPARATVPTCPEWQPRDLAVHVVLFCDLWTHVLCEGTGRPRPDDQAAPDGPPDAVAAWVADRVALLHAELEATDPDAPVWTWSLDAADHRAAFVARRSAHELAVHRVDAELAGGPASAVEATLAADGIDEVLFIVDQWQRAGDPRARGVDGERLALRATDTDDRWLVTLAPEGVTSARTEGPADLTLTASASDLAMVVNSRPPLGPVTRDGDEAVLAAWQRTFTFGSDLLDPHRDRT